MESNKIWFKARKNGWGWTPATWQGWLIAVAFVIYIAKRLIATQSPLELLLPVVILLLICYFKGEKPHLKWGDKDQLL